MSNLLTSCLQNRFKCCEVQADSTSMLHVHKQQPNFRQKAGGSLGRPQQYGIGVVVAVVGDDLIVDEIAQGGPADKQGLLQLGDIIIRVNGKEVRGGQPDGKPTSSRESSKN
jgi:C-terminal processing protease CtpA/Prc